MAISPPHELLDLPDRGELVTRVTAWEEGPCQILVGKLREPKTVTCIRLHVPPEDKQTVPSYWDVTSTRLHVWLRVHLPVAVQERRWIRVQKFGVAPRATFSAEIFPPGVGGPAFVGVRS
ncbi:MAG: hypothetical protein ACREKK_06605 [Candidatus Methylomirabilales bacterium]